MNEFVEVLEQERQRQINWVKSLGTCFDGWVSKNGYNYSKTMPRNFIVPKPMLDKAIKWYQILFVTGFVIALLF
jgi:hypothetical protein